MSIKKSLKNKILTIDDLFDSFGGSVHIASILDLNQWTVERWRKTGIPEKYHETIASNINLTPVDIYKISRNSKNDSK